LLTFIYSDCVDFGIYVQLYSINSICSVVNPIISKNSQSDPLAG
jgi:hypothetical protein